MARDFYQALGVSRDASTEEIDRAYRKLARRYHPDVNSGPEAEDRFKEISEAHQVLSDPETRKRYDRFGEDFRRVPEGYDADDRVRAGSGRGRRRGTGGRGGVWVGGSYGGAGPAGINIDDLFGDLFSGAGPIRGADQEAELELTVEEAYRGGQRRLTLSGGSGSQTIDVTIPPGVVDGQRIRLSGQGGRGNGNAQAGDLYLVVRIAPHPRYRLSGRDIHLQLPVTPWEAALGATVPVTIPDGEVKVRVPPGSSSGRRLRLRGEGMPNPNGRPGDLYVEVRIHVPPRLNKRERQLFEELAAVSHFDPRASQ